MQSQAVGKGGFPARGIFKVRRELRIDLIGRNARVDKGRLQVLLQELSFGRAIAGIAAQGALDHPGQRGEHSGVSSAIGVCSPAAMRTRVSWGFWPIKGS